MGVRSIGWGAVFVVAFALLVAGCAMEAPTCATPYIQNGNTCCIDRDANAVCDVDENASLRSVAALTEGTLDCSLCPPKFLTQKEEVIVYKYVCMDDRVVEDPDLCGKRVESTAKLFTLDTLQDPAYVALFEARPACRGKYRAAELHLVTTSVPTKITLQYKDDPEGEYKDLRSPTPDDDLYHYIGFCDEECSELTDSRLDPDRTYVLHAVIEFPDKKISTKDLLIDATPDAEFGKKTCS